MKLDYGTQISPSPIKLSIGRIKKPRLIDISEISFPKFDAYESLIKLTPKTFLSQIIVDDGKSIWDTLPIEERDGLSMFDIICMNNNLANEYAKVFDFFFVEKVSFDGRQFVLKNNDFNDGEKCSGLNKTGYIGKDNFLEVINIIEQICCIDNKEEDKPVKFKNNAAKKIYEKMKIGKKKSSKKEDLNYTIPNLISAVCSMHNSLNPVNIWDITIYQLLDQFNRLTTKAIYQIEQTRVSVWGDEKKHFDATLWYKNEFNKK